MGTATLTNTNVYSNKVAEVCSPLLPVPRSFFQRPTGVDRLLCVLMAGGEFSRQIEPTGVTFHCPAGTLRARVLLAGCPAPPRWRPPRRRHGNSDQLKHLLQHCNYGACSPLCNVPLPRWIVTCAHGWQNGWGGGLFIAGTATLTDTNVYANEAGYVCSPFELASIAPSGTLRARFPGRVVASTSTLEARRR